MDISLHLQGGTFRKVFQDDPFKLIWIGLYIIWSEMTKKSI